MPANELPEDISFDPKSMLNVLTSHGVRFVVVGGIAAIYHASPYATFDLDICPKDDDENLWRLSEALIEMEARMRFTDETEPMRIDFNPRVLRSAPFLNLVTRWGPLDIVPQPAASGGYDSLVRDAIIVRLGDTEVVVASRSDVLRSKEALYRDKDVPTIRLFQELEERDLEEKAPRKRGQKDR